MTVSAPLPDQQRPAFHAAVLDGLPEAVVVATPDGVITFVNAATENLLGYGPIEVVGQPITVLVPRDPERRADPVKWLARWAAEPRAEPSRFLDLTARRRDGVELPVEVRVQAGQVDGEARYFITVRDLTARRKEQAALKDANLRAARILMVAEDAIVSIDGDQKIILFNPAAEAMFGYRAEEVLDRSLSMLIPAYARAGHAERVDGFRHDKAPSRMMSDRPEVLGCRRNGQVFPLEATITKVMAAGTLTFTAHLRDVTERNRVRNQLEESERRIRAIFDHASQAIALLTPEGLVLEINRAAAGLTAVGEADGSKPLVGAPLWEAPWLGLDLVGGATYAELLKAAIGAAAGGQSGRLSVQLSRHGAALPIEVRLTPIFGEAGRVDYVLAEGRFEA